ncbi:hypothetical protein [Pontibacter sp. H249]|uniref:hypothetical protein n=1 Tax=Pontibacter sp. H249 TaxID=3133420 RepID=UPI0030BCADDF
MQHSVHKACVRYYYLPARHDKYAEIIEVVNSQHYTIDVPMWEEDIILEPFYTRFITTKEEKHCRGSEIWKLFSGWEKLYSDHQKYEVEEKDVLLLKEFKNTLLLSKGVSNNMVA